MTDLKLGIAGLGTVGDAVVARVQAEGDLIRQRVGSGLSVTAVAARDRHKVRGCKLDTIRWCDDPLQLAAAGDIDVVVDLMGGADELAYRLGKAALQNGKPFVTANKALIAAHGRELAELAESKGVTLAFEAAVCGGIPVLKCLREGLAGNRVTAIRGILNGTCNYILMRMEEAGLDFDAALAEAQAEGYAEADPARDIEGLDTANKLAVLAALAFGTEPDLAGVSVEGIASITPADLHRARAQNCRIKLLGFARRVAGGVMQCVKPVPVPLNVGLAHTAGPMNAVTLFADAAGPVVLAGRGAGGAATASAVIADIIDIAAGLRRYAFGVHAAQLRRAARVEVADELLKGI